MQSHGAAPGKRWELHIHKVNGKWTVDSPDGYVSRGIDHRRKPDPIDNRDTDTVEWILDSDPDDPKQRISAHFQFGDSDLFENLPGQKDLTRDWTAEIQAPGGTLELRVNHGACRRKNPRHYAVWIRDESHPSGTGGEFAVGGTGNPPPDMEVGP